jgi:thiol-disulfide isomerase/thioredoxin
MKIKNSILIVVVILIIGGILFLESRKADTNSLVEDDDLILPDDSSEDAQDRREIKAKKFEEAKEISSPDGFINTPSINSGQADGITISELIGKKVILIDFWTYSCINCQRTLPHLNQWYDKYKDQGLEIIGLHTPEFEFEKDYENVLRAVEKFGVKHPVVLDNDFSTWTSYKNRYWPRKYLIDIDGFIVYDHIGEGGYEETEAKIVELLNERKIVLGEEEMVSLQINMPKNAPKVDFSQIRTPEIYLGWGRAEFLANFPSQNCIDSACNYILPSEIALNTYVFGGDWRIAKESSVLEGSEGVIGIAFNANKVNLVVDTASGATAEIWLDDEKIGDVTFDKADLYTLVDLGENYGQHILEIRIKGKGFSVFAFTFG